MTPAETRGRIFRVTARHSGKSLSLRPSLGPTAGEPGGRIVLCQENVSNKAEQQFLLFPMDDGSFVIASRANGRVVDIFDHSNGDRAACILHPFHGEDNQRFTIEDAGNAFCFIRAKHSGKVIDVKGNNNNNRALVHQFRQKSEGFNNQLFKFDQVGTYQMPVTTGIGQLPGVPMPTSIQDNLPAETAQAVMGETLLPYFVISETLPQDKQAQQTPYYRLQKLQSWSKVHQRVFSGPAQTQKHTVTNGMKKTHNVEMSKTTSLSIEIDGAKFLSKLAGLKTTVTGTLAVKESTSTETSSSVELEREVSYPRGASLLYAEYILHSQFSLHRSNGVEVKNRWDATNADEMRQVAFPVAGMQSLSIQMKRVRTS